MPLAVSSCFASSALVRATSVSPKTSGACIIVGCTEVFQLCPWVFQSAPLYAAEPMYVARKIVLHEFQQYVFVTCSGTSMAMSHFTL
mmetsp:Transcript_14245/g.43749  ORF Transcript_14245/g.43749 Transcript_14245/m.43749 type:complete len:87 (-) Transcript_14245:726-986(-)